ncbi:hypothetical protein SLS57_004570 [Botryosphaeria dothidea]
MSDSRPRHPAPPIDPEIASLLPPIPDLAEPMDDSTVAEQRAALATIMAPIKQSILSDPAIAHTERTIPGPGGPLAISVLTAKAPASGKAAPKRRPGIVHFHGGGMTMGDRWVGMGLVAEYVRTLDAVAITVEYRLAPEHAHPAPVEDCYATLAWAGAHADELGVDGARLMVAGESAGGGLAAAVALMARDRGGPALCAQLLVCPMLDDRNESVSSRQVVGGGTWSRRRNLFGWRCLLGEKAGGDDVSCYAAPARATDLSGLPQAFIDAGSAETFRDEDVAYASKLWECGVQAELHVWPGGPHAFHTFLPNAALSRVANATRTNWVRRVLKENSNVASNDVTSKI